MTTFYSFPAGFGERPILPVMSIFDGDMEAGPTSAMPAFAAFMRARIAERRMREIPSAWPWTFASGPCHFPNLRPALEDRLRTMVASYYDRPSRMPSRVDGLIVDELAEEAERRFPPGTRTVRIPVIGPLTARSITENSPLDDDYLAIRTIEATPRQVVETERLARRYNIPWDWLVENVLGVDTAYPRPTTRQRLREDVADRMGAYAGAVMGRAMADYNDRRIMALLWGMPMDGTDAEEMREWLARVGVEMPGNLPAVSYMTGHTLLREAKTLRQRCFARMVNWWNPETGELILQHAGKRKVKPLGKRLPNLMAACRRDKGLRKALSALPIARAPYALAGDPEVVEGLQDLADIVAQEAQRAFTERYYPGVQGVDPLTDAEVDAVMAGLQREVDREHRGKQVPYYGRLPRARQVALAERRRHWFGVFGVTPKSWRKGTWGLWKVQNAPYPDGYRELPS